MNKINMSIMIALFISINQVSAYFVPPQPYIAHAGGAINRQTNTNSLEALIANYQKGFRFFEVDIETTTDNHHVILHDWSKTYQLSLTQYQNYISTQELTYLTLDDLLVWLEAHADAYIITDVKTNNIDVLTKISLLDRNTKNRIIPQVYSFDEYSAVKKLGFEKIILTLYRTYYTPTQVIDFAQKNKPFAITMAIETASTGLPLKLKEKGIFVYAFTVNDEYTRKKLKSNGVSGFYTDYLGPK